MAIPAGHDTAPPDRAVIFDLDDTLVRNGVAGWARDRPTGPMTGAAQAFYRAAERVADRRITNAVIAKVAPKQAMPDAVDLVTALLDRGVLVAVITSTRREAAVADLGRLGFPVDRFFLVQGGDDAARKPDPAVFDAALARLHAYGVQDVTYVGDTTMDAQAAAGAGIEFIAVTTGFDGPDAFPGVPVVASLDELRPLLLD